MTADGGISGLVPHLTTERTFDLYSFADEISLPYCWQQGCEKGTTHDAWQLLNCNLVIIPRSISAQAAIFRIIFKLLHEIDIEIQDAYYNNEAI